MVSQINKNILTVKEGTIVHSVNCIGAVGGLAGAIGRLWPTNVRVYKEKVKREGRSKSLLGDVLWVQVAPKLHICNLFGQYNIGLGSRQTDYIALAKGFQLIEKSAHRDIYIPYRIGCGLGGGDWDYVLEMITKTFGSSGKQVYICSI